MKMKRNKEVLMKNKMIDIIEGICECKSLLTVAMKSAYADIDCENLVTALEITRNKLDAIINEFDGLI